jgi:hypothetical protein
MEKLGGSDIQKQILISLLNQTVQIHHHGIYAKI